MENYNALFQLTTANGLRAIIHKLNEEDPEACISFVDTDGKEELMVLLDDYIEADSDGYDIESLDNAIIKAFNIKLTRATMNGIKEDKYSIKTVNRFTAPKTRDKVRPIVSTKVWTVELSINGKTKTSDFFMGAGLWEKRKRLANPRLEGNKSVTHEWVDWNNAPIMQFDRVRTSYETDQLLSKFRSVSVRPAQPNALFILDHFVSDAGCVELGWTTEKDFCEELGYMDGFDSVMKGIENYKYCVQMHKDLLDMLRV